MKPDGIVMLNIGGALRGDAARFFHAELATYRSVFRYVAVFRVRPTWDETRVQNMIIAASDEELVLPANLSQPISEILANRIETPGTSQESKILTDDLAPVEYFASGF
jgi:hypothetical protein